MANKVFDNSIFSEYFSVNDSEAAAWASNTLQKLIAGEGAPKYVLRKNTDEQDTDFSLWYSAVTVFFSYLVKLSRVFRDFKQSDFLVDQYLNHKNQFTCSTQSLSELTDVVSNLLRVFSRRGSLDMIQPSSNIGVSAHGEVLRLICWDLFTFFKLGVAQSQYNGWNVNNCSPLYKGCTNRYDLNVAWEYTKDVVDLSAYPLINNNYVFLSNYRGNDCIQLEGVPFGDISGIGDIDLTKDIIIDPRLDFEITFYVAQDITLENISFGCKAFDISGNEISLQSIVTGANEEMFFETRRLNRAGVWYQIRGIIYNKDHDLLTIDESRLNIGFGRNLRFTEDVVSIIPYIIMDNNFGDDSDAESDNFDSESTSIDLGESGFDDESDSYDDSAYDSEPSVFLWNIKVTPCSTNYSRCYLNNKNFIDIFLSNKNGKYTNEQIDEILRRYFIPYNTAFETTFIDSIAQLVIPRSYLLLEDGVSYLLLEDGSRILLEISS